MARRHKLLLWPIFLCLMVTPLFGAEQRVEEIVENSWRALGGRDRWQAIGTLEIAGTQTSFSQAPRPFLVQRQRPNLYRFDHYELTHEFIIAYDGEMAWWKRTLLIAAKGNWPLAAPVQWAEWITADAEFDYPFLSYRERGHHLDFQGEFDLDGEPTYELEVTLRNGHVQQWYIAVDSYLPVARIDSIFYVKIPQERRTYFSDYREIGGVMVPYHIELEYGNEYRVMDVDEVRLNAEIDPRVFELPPPVGMEALRNLVGSFSVEVDSHGLDAASRASGLLKKTKTSSVIHADFHNALLDEEISLVAADSPLKVRRLISYDRFRDIYRIAYFDNLTAHLIVLEGGFKDKRLVVSDVATGTTWKTYRNVNNTRLVYYDIDDAGFKLDVEISHDGGETWILDRRLTYTRTEEP